MSPSNDILIRGDEAAKAKPIDLVHRPEPGQVGAVGPWADQVNDARESARRSGFEQGRKEGYAVGLEHGRRQVEQKLAGLARSVDALMAAVDERCNEVGDRLAAGTTALALEIAEAVLRREVALAADPGAEAIVRCLELAPSTGDLVARLHPDDAANVGDVLGLGERKLTIVDDPSLDRGDAVVTIDDATIDARLSESLRRVGEALQ